MPPTGPPRHPQRKRPNHSPLHKKWVLFPGVEGSLLGPGLLNSPFTQAHMSPWEQVDTQLYINIWSSRSATHRRQPLARRQRPFSPSCRRPLGTRPCSPGKGTCRWWAAPPCNAEHTWSCGPRGQGGPSPGPHLSQRSLFFQPGLGPGFFRIFGSSDFLASLLSLFLPETL